MEGFYTGMATLETLKSLILDFHESPLDTGVPRRLRIEPVPGKATVCIGVRRSGKSTYLFQRIEGLMDRGVPRQNILYLNFFDDRLHGLNQENIGLVAEAYYSLFPEKKGAETVYCFFDEIQAVTGWESFVERLMRTEQCEVYLSGSSAQMLSKEIATQMRGRALSWEIFPFSFREFLDAQGIAIEGEMATKTRLRVEKAFDQFWQTGGFPEVVRLESGDPPARTSGGIPNGENTRRGGWTPNPSLRVKIHQEYFHAILYRDLVERHDISHPNAVSDLAHWLVDNTASLYSINRLTGYLKSLGHHAPKPAVSEYLEWFEDSYFLFTVRIFDASRARVSTNPKKIYCVDHALVTSVASGVLLNSGHLLENLVFVGLRRQYPNICYYKTKSDREIDFIVPLGAGKRRLVQVTESLADPRTRTRELSALSEGMRELGVRTGTVVTRTESEQIEVDAGAITVVPAWRFLLELSHPDPRGQN